MQCQYKHTPYTLCGEFKYNNQNGHSIVHSTALQMALAAEVKDSCIV